MMRGWIVPPPKEPTKSEQEFGKEREEKVKALKTHGYLVSKPIEDAMLRVRREDFVPGPYRDYAYEEVPLPLPGEEATISCPHSYPLFYEPLGLDKGHRFLEVGLGSGYGTALAKEIVGADGLVVAIEIDHLTFQFARDNLEKAGYEDIVLVEGDGGMGHPKMSPYDKICVTAACESVPSPLIEQLSEGGRLIAPVVEKGIQNLVLLEKSGKAVKEKRICEVLYVSLRGEFGTTR
ncbi:MAG: protein-L-isoaspartate O-methyltransferase [Desulfobacteraceae bacterium]|jgi:protein-L-isoaspartate(D-aspartate) O-methyltransferase